MKKLLHIEGELCVCRIEEALDLPQPTASRHLKQLKAAGWLVDRRRGKWVYYRLPENLDPAWRSVLDIFMKENSPSLNAKIGSPQKTSDFCSDET